VQEVSEITGPASFCDLAGVKNGLAVTTAILNEKVLLNWLKIPSIGMEIGAFS
jgi:hypothetical protein